MTPEERDLIGGLFQRLQQSGGGALDREAADYIARCIQQLPAAPYYLTQAVLVQDHALKGAQARIGELEGALEQARAAQQGVAQSQSPTSGGTSFLGGLLGNTQGGAGQTGAGPWGRHATSLPPAAPAPAPSTPPPPAYQQPQPHPQAQATAVPSAFGRGGGFMQSALSTAAGVAGGALLFQGIESMLGYHNSPFSRGGFGGGYGGQPGLAENNTTINNYSDAANGPDAGGGPDAGTDPTDPAQNADQADASDPSYDDGSGGDPGMDDSGDFGGGDDGGGDDGSDYA